MKTRRYLQHVYRDCVNEDADGAAEDLSEADGDLPGKLIMVRRKTDTKSHQSN